MTDDLKRQIVELEASLSQPMPEPVRRLVEQQLAQLRQQRDSLVNLSGAQTGDVTIGDTTGRDKVTSGELTLSGDARLNGVAVAVNLGTIIYGRDPSEDERRQLARYLARLAAKLRRLPLSGLAARLDDGDGVALERVYVMLATQESVDVAEGPLRTLTRFFRDDQVPDSRSGERVYAQLKDEHHHDYALPDTAVVVVAHTFASQSSESAITSMTLSRRQLVTEAVAQRECLVLLGDPGGGKSTFLRYLAWALAQRGLDQLDDRTQLLGWADDVRLLPVLLPLRRLAGQIIGEGASPAVVTSTLVREMEREYGARDAADLLDRALVRGSALLLLDGLDEVPVEATPTSASRLSTLHAVRAFVDLYPAAKLVITCRTRVLSDELRSCLGWDVALIAPFTLGQIRHFVDAWFATLRTRGSLDQAQSDHYAQALTDSIVGSERLRRMAETPLLLTMMALVLVERGELPRDRPLLYEEVLRQLLGEWDVQKGGQSLAEVLGAPNLRGDDLRPILDQLSFVAHAGAASEDGRGRLLARDLRLTLTEYLEKVWVPGAWEAAGRCLVYFSERSGLLLPEDDGGSYAFAHLTLQEHGAGRHLLLQPTAVRAVLERRADDRWREPISLGLGVVQRLYPMLADRIDRIFAELIDPDEGGRPKDRVRWYRDLIMAAELGKERDWNLLRALISVDRLQRELRRGLVALLGDNAQPLPTAERVRAGFLLGELGDPRVPVTVDDWRREVRRALNGDTSGYFCRVAAGTYWIGSADDEPDAKDTEKPRHAVTFDAPFYIARYPVTNTQWAAWVAQGGRPASYADDSDLNRPNQPVVGLRWKWCNNFCAWLRAQANADIRLPTEAEWEAAARGGDTRRYPWGDDWRDEHAASEENQESHGWTLSVPIGGFPTGAAPCGALDIVGNVREWTSSVWQSYPEAKEIFIGKDMCVIRGGSYRDNRTDVRCGARGGYRLDLGGINVGFRVVLSYQLKQEPITDGR